MGSENILLIFGCSIHSTTEDISIAIIGKIEKIPFQVKMPEIKNPIENTIGHTTPEAHFLPLFA